MAHDQIVEVAGEPGAITSERDTLDVRALLRADKPSQPSVNFQPPDPEIEMAPDRVVMLLVLAIARGVRALRATKTPSP
jgi:hypothetical protein